MKSLILLLSAAVLSGCSSTPDPPKPTSSTEQQYWKRILTPQDYLRDLNPRDRQMAEFEMGGGSTRQRRRRP